MSFSGHISPNRTRQGSARERFLKPAGRFLLALECGDLAPHLSLRRCAAAAELRFPLPTMDCGDLAPRFPLRRGAAAAELLHMDCGDLAPRFPLRRGAAAAELLHMDCGDLAPRSPLRRGAAAAGLLHMECGDSAPHLLLRRGAAAAEPRSPLRRGAAAAERPSPVARRRGNLRSQVTALHMRKRAPRWGGGNPSLVCTPAMQARTWARVAGRAAVERLYMDCGGLTPRLLLRCGAAAADLLYMDCGDLAPRSPLRRGAAAAGLLHMECGDSAPHLLLRRGAAAAEPRSPLRRGAAAAERPSPVARRRGNLRSQVTALHMRKRAPRWGGGNPSLVCTPALQARSWVRDAGRADVEAGGVA